MNAQLNKLSAMLRLHGYSANRYHQISREEEGRGDLILEWWLGPKGVIIVQHEKGVPGVQTFGDWPLGSKFDELERVLFAVTTRGFDRSLNVKGVLWDGTPSQHAYDIPPEQPDPTTLDEARKNTGDFESLSDAELVRNDWVINTTTTVNYLK